MNLLAFMDEELERLRQEGLYNYVRTIESAQGAWIQVDGKRVLNLCSNNYLGFADHPRLKEAAKRAVEEWGVGPAAVRSIAGTLSLHRELEARLAEFKRAEAVICLQAGFIANLAVIPALIGPDDIIFSDELNHASIIDGCRLSRAPIVRFAHCDPEDLRSKLRERRAEGKRAIVITDGVFSMDGDIAPLGEIAHVSHEFDAFTMVDDAHGEGVLGESGRGIVDHLHLHGLVEIEVGTLSKAFGVVGGFVAGSTRLRDFLYQRARPFLFSSAQTAADAAACIAAVKILQESDDLVRKLWNNARHFQEGLKAVGLDTGKTQTPITPVMLGDAQTAQLFSRRLFEERIFAMAIGYPTVPRGKARIRCMVSATHSREDLDFAISVFERVGKELGVLKG
ncbi:MAG: glycine C-acetyltransferase [bacterium JZ-2024 1]